MSIETINSYLKLMDERPELLKSNTVSDGLLLIQTTQAELLTYEKEKQTEVGVVYESPWRMMLRDVVYDKQTQSIYAYERLVAKNTKSAIAVLPKYKDKFVLLYQYRHIAGGFVYNIPRGFGEKNLTWQENVKKEIQEETGSTVIDVTNLGTVVCDNGLCGDEVTICCCEITEPKVQEHEGIKKICLFREEELHNFIATGKITDSFTLSALSLYNMRVRKKW